MPRKPNQYGVKKRGDRWTAHPYVPGRSKKVWAGTWDTEAEATAAALAKIEEERRLPAQKETIDTFVKRWLKDFPRPKESTMDRYRSDAGRFAKKYGAKKLHEIDKPTARSWAQAHPHDHAALRAMYGDAMRDGLVLSNPFSELRISKGRGRRDISPITVEELGTLGDLAVAAHEDFGHTFRAIIVFAASTGLRPGEIFGLDWCDIDFEAETIHVRQQFHKGRLTLPKSGRTRTVFLPPPAAKALREMPRTVRAEHVFTGKLGQRITQGSLNNYWTPVRVAFEAGLDPRRRLELRSSSQSGKAALDFYSLRHACATYLVEQGVESWIVAKQLGHEDGGRLVESTYGHPRDEVARERLRRVFAQPTELRAVEDESEAANG